MTTKWFHVISFPYWQQLYCRQPTCKSMTTSCSQWNFFVTTDKNYDVVYNPIEKSCACYFYKTWRSQRIYSFYRQQINDSQPTAKKSGVIEYLSTRTYTQCQTLLFIGLSYLMHCITYTMLSNLLVFCSFSVKVSTNSTKITCAHHCCRVSCGSFPVLIIW